MRVLHVFKTSSRVSFGGGETFIDRLCRHTGVWARRTPSSPSTRRKPARPSRRRTISWFRCGRTSASHQPGSHRRYGRAVAPDPVRTMSCTTTRPTLTQNCWLSPDRAQRRRWRRTTPTRFAIPCSARPIRCCSGRSTRAWTGLLRRPPPMSKPAQRCNGLSTKSAPSPLVSARRTLPPHRSMNVGPGQSGSHRPSPCLSEHSGHTKAYRRCCRPSGERAFHW